MLTIIRRYPGGIGEGGGGSGGRKKDIAKLSEPDHSSHLDLLISRFMQYQF